MTASMDLAAVVLLEVLRYFAVECMVTSILIGAVPALLLLAVLLKLESRKGPLSFQEIRERPRSDLNPFVTGQPLPDSPLR
jgi:hypothetical protein